MTTDEMYTVEQAALLVGAEASAIRLAIRSGELRAWSLPAQRGLLVRKSDLTHWKLAKENNLPLDPDDRAYGFTTTNIAPWDIPEEE